MTTTPDAPRADVLTTTLVGGAAVALLDAANPIIFWYADHGMTPDLVFKSIAAGLLGKEKSFAGGAGVVCLGIALHLFIACAVAAVYGVATRWLPVLIRRPVVCGIAYGAAVYAVMNDIVLPLSRAKPQSFLLFDFFRDLFKKGTDTVTTEELWFLSNFLGHLFLVGLPVAFIARWSARRFTFPLPIPAAPRD